MAANRAGCLAELNYFNLWLPSVPPSSRFSVPRAAGVAGIPGGAPCLCGSPWQLPANCLAASVLAMWPVLRCRTARLAARNGPFQGARRPVLRRKAKTPAFAADAKAGVACVGRRLRRLLLRRERVMNLYPNSLYITLLRYTVLAFCSNLVAQH